MLRAQAADEAVQQVRHDMALLSARIGDYTEMGLRIRLDGYADQLARALAAGPVVPAEADGSDGPTVDRVCADCGKPTKVLVAELEGPDDPAPIACWECQ